MNFVHSLLLAAAAQSLFASAAVAQQADEAAPPPSPAAQAVLAANPQTPAELIRAINVLVDLRQAAAARPLAESLLAAGLDDAACSGLVDQFGAAVFLKIGRQAELQPAGEQLATAVIDGAERYAHDPAFLATLVDELTHDSRRVRTRAAERLGRTGGEGAAAVVAALADESRADGHDRLRDGLALLGESAVGPMVAGLDSDDPALHVHLAIALGGINRVAAAEALLAPAFAPNSPVEVRDAALESLSRLLSAVPSATKAASTLYGRGREHFHSAPASPQGAVESLVIWHWDADARRPVGETLPPAESQFAIAARLAAAARRIAPESIAARRLHLQAIAEGAQHRAGLDQPLPSGPGTAHALISEEGAAAVEDMLADALAADRAAAATAAVQVLGALGDASVLRRNGGPSALIRAVEHPDRRLRFAALEAIVALAPSQPFAGSSRVTDTLLYFVQSSGRPRALVADRRADEASRLAGMLSSLGYDAEIVLSGRDLLKHAVSSGDYELALVDAALATPVSGLLIQQLRRDVRTIRLPVGVVASSAQDAAARDVASRNARAAAIVCPQDAAALKFQVDRLLDATGRDGAGPEQRREQCRRALGWIAALSANAAGVFDLARLEAPLIELLAQPALAADVCPVLARFATRECQRALIDAASAHARPLELRQAAVAAFCESVGLHGTRLGPTEVMRQYDRYNASETLDTATQQLLGQALDAIEARAAADQLALESPQSDAGPGR